MAEPFIAEIRLFAGNFAPRGWVFCTGQLLQIAQNTAVFSIVGTTYGGDGRTTFGIPDFRDRAPMHAGTGPGLTTRRLGERAGAAEVTLTESQLPNHGHTLRAHGDPFNALESMPASNRSYSAKSGGGLLPSLFGPPTDLVTTDPFVADAGSSQPHNNRQPVIAINFIFAILGVFPSRS
ncbi:MAG: tail fiber protein [Pseudomonadota bacterium]